MRGHAKPAHVSLDDIDGRVVDRIADTIELPSTRKPKVFVDAASSASELMSIQCQAQLDVLRRLLLRLLERLQLFRIIVMYIVVHGGRTDNTKGY